MAHGHVICGHCEASFDSLATLAEQLPPEPFVELPINEPSLQPPRLDLVVYRPRPRSLAVIELAAATEDDVTDDFSRLVFAPRFAREAGASKPHTNNGARTRHARSRRTSLAVGAGLLGPGAVAAVCNWPGPSVTR